jgi:uncharacterized OB-fold protein
MSAELTPWYKQIENTVTLIGMQCESCGRQFFPPRATCPKCRSKALNPIDLPTVGQLVTWTVTRVLPEGHEEETAILGVTDFDGTLILAKIKGVNAAKLEADLPLTVELDSKATDPTRPSYLFHFVPGEKKDL